MRRKKSVLSKKLIVFATFVFAVVGILTVCFTGTEAHARFVDNDHEFIWPPKAADSEGKMTKNIQGSKVDKPNPYQFKTSDENGNVNTKFSVEGLNIPEYIEVSKKAASDNYQLSHWMYTLFNNMTRDYAPYDYGHIDDFAYNEYVNSRDGGQRGKMTTDDERYEYGDNDDLNSYAIACFADKIDCVSSDPSMGNVNLHGTNKYLYMYDQGNRHWEGMNEGVPIYKHGFDPLYWNKHNDLVIDTVSEYAKEGMSDKKDMEDYGVGYSAKSFFNDDGTCSIVFTNDNIKYRNESPQHSPVDSSDKGEHKIGYVDLPTASVQYDAVAKEGKYINKGVVSGLSNDNNVTVDIYPGDVEHKFLSNDGIGEQPLKVEAVFSAEPIRYYNVHFDKNNNEATGEMQDQTFRMEQSKPLSKHMFSLARYSFAGWAIEPTGDVVYKDEQEVCDLATISGQVINLYAKWVPGYTVNYDTDGGSYVEPKIGIQGEEDHILPSENPKKNGYYLYHGTRENGWTLIDNETRYCDIANSELEESSTILAHGEPRDGYTVYYNTNGGSEIEPRNNVSWVGCDLGQDKIPTKTGEQFAGWYVDDQLTTPYVEDMTYGDIAVQDTVMSITLYAKGKDPTYTVNYQTNGGSEVEPLENLQYNDDNLIPTAPPTKAGFIFAGWYSTSDFSAGSEVDKNKKYSEIASSPEQFSITLYAKGTAKTGYTLNFEANGGTSVVSKTGLLGDSNNLLASVTTSRAGYTFAGGFVDDKTFKIQVTDQTTYGQIAKTEVPEATIYAKGVEKSNYTVKYDSKDGTPVDDKTSVAGTQANLLPDPAPLKPGYSLEGGYSDSECSKSVDSNTTYGQIAVTEKEYVTLYAKGQEKTDYVVNYVTNCQDTIEPITVVYTATGLLPSKPLSKVGYNLEGGYSKSDFSGPPVTNDTKYSDIATLGEPSIILYAKWTPKTGYTVKYDTEGGVPTTLSDLTEQNGESKNLIPATTVSKVGYTLAGWCVDEQFGTPITADTTYGDIAKVDTITTITLYAKGVEKTNYKVIYNTNGGSPIEDKSPVSWTSKGLLPTKATTKAGYTFDHWCIDSTLKTEATNEMTYGQIAKTEKESITLYAKGTENKDYVVNYDTNEGSHIGSLTGIRGTQANLLPSIDPTKAGYSFGGGFSDKGLTTSVIKETKYCEIAVTEKESITLYAKGIEKTTYKVNYDAKGGSPTPTALENVAGTRSGLLPANTPVLAGYELEGWYGEDTYVTKVNATTKYGDIAKTEKAEITLYAKWVEKTNYKVNYDTNGGTPSIGPKENVHGTGSNLIPAVTPTKSGYVLDAWCSDITLQNDVTDETKYCEIAGDDVESITLYARGTERSGYYLIYDTHGGTTYFPKTDISGTDSNLLPTGTPEKAGYNFAGWYSDDKTFQNKVTNSTTYSSFADELAEYATIYVKWTPKTNYKVNYNTGEGSTVDPLKNVSWERSNLLPEDEPTYDWHVLEGWYSDDVFTKQVTNETTYGDIAIVEMPEITLYAKWIDNVNYVVNYETFGGTQYDSKTGVAKGDNDLLPGTPTRAGYTFKGWFSDEACTKSVSNNDTYQDIAVTDKPSITLYAKGIEKKDYEVKISFDGGQTYTVLENIAWTQNHLLPDPEPTREGYYLEGWYTEPMDANGRVSNMRVTQETTYGEIAQLDLPSISIFAHGVPVDVPVPEPEYVNGGTASTGDNLLIVYSVIALGFIACACAFALYRKKELVKLNEQNTIFKLR